MEFDVVIVGGGLVGASLAAALKNSGLSLALVEGQPATFSHEGWDPRVYAITPGNVEFLKQCGSWQRQDMARIQPVEAMRVFGDDNSELEFSAYEIGAPELTFILENRLMQEALWETIRDQDNLTLFNPARCAKLDLAFDAATLTLDDGRELRAKLIVGADGRDSWVRKQAGMDAAPTPYQQHGVVANFRCEKPHRGVAYQWFRPDSILAYLPLPQNMMSMVWSVLPEKSAELLKLSPETLCAQVAEAGHHTLGGLELVTPAASFALRILRLPHIAKARLALVGDAAHNVHPLAGQGVNLGFRDARELAQVLLNRGPQPDCGDPHLLRRYDRARQEDIYSMLTTTNTLKNLFCNDDRWLSKARNLGLAATNRVTPIKRMLAKHALI
jgi:ubiquinone biosynthesis UbiH/UbiF/VisC/COQ6 family hydroxylase